MKKSVIIRPKKLKKINIDYKTVLLFSLFICGIVLGISVFENANDEIKNLFIKYTENSITAKSNNQLIQLFSSSVLLMIVPIISTYVLGLCATGIPLIWFMPILWGMINGLLVSIYFTSYTLEGICFFALTLLPGYAITAATIIKCCCESSVMSLNIFSAITNTKGYTNKTENQFKEYTINYLILSIPIIASAIINTLAFKCFCGLFSFI